MASASLGAGSDECPKAKPTVHVRVDLQALRRGHCQSGEVCEIGGVPFPVAAARQLIDDAAVWLLLVDGIDVHKIVRWDRHIPQPLRQALIERDRVCNLMGCDRTDGLEWDRRNARKPGAKTTGARSRAPASTG